jgi:diadenosine tetraphosphate (Ap4A) HIT family hydrolase
MSKPPLQHIDCFICHKHRGDIMVPGGAIYEDALVYAGHAAIPEGEETAYLGALLVEPKRHAAGLADVTDEEAQRIGLLAAWLSRALKASEGAEHIYQFVMGHHVDHLHVWIIPRYPGAPREYWGVQVDEWPDAPRGDAETIAALCERLRVFLQAEANSFDE